MTQEVRDSTSGLVDVLEALRGGNAGDRGAWAHRPSGGLDCRSLGGLQGIEAGGLAMSTNYRAKLVALVGASAATALLTLIPSAGIEGNKTKTIPGYRRCLDDVRGCYWIPG